MILVRSETGQWGGASWGRTRERCANLGAVMDGLFDDGRLDDTIEQEITADGGHIAATTAIRELNAIQCGAMAPCVGPVERAISALLPIANPDGKEDWTP